MKKVEVKKVSVLVLDEEYDEWNEIEKVDLVEENSRFSLSIDFEIEGKKVKVYLNNL